MDTFSQNINALEHPEAEQHGRLLALSLVECSIFMREDVICCEYAL